MPQKHDYMKVVATYKILKEWGKHVKEESFLIESHGNTYARGLCVLVMAAVSMLGCSECC